MITFILWSDYNDKLYSTYGFYKNYSYTKEELAWYLILYVLITPIIFILDIFLSPIELIYLICLKIVKFIRKKM